MRPEDLLELIRARPFVPLRIHTTDGQTYELRHPDQAIVLRSRLVLAVGGQNGIPEGLEHIALLHVVRVEQIPAQQVSPS
ncbi:MAG: hypothetical protein HY000_21815 [Planctomycetes bacterium]|nr:hypothetical protein [Planctomycetota bacterium]